jgi:hypothetical protein
MAQRHYLAPLGMVRNYSYVEHDGTRYGAFTHTSGKGYCYGYINDHYPVRVDRILHIAFPGQPDMQTICALVRPFQVPRIEPQFPWDNWYVLRHIQVCTYIHYSTANLHKILGVFT